MDKHTRVISVSGRTYRATPTMCDIFLAHASDIRARNLSELVPLLHEDGVELIFISETTTITVADLTKNVVRSDITGQIPELPTVAA